jgi:hypothetical protein
MFKLKKCKKTISHRVTGQLSPDKAEWGSYFAPGTEHATWVTTMYASSSPEESSH